MYRILVLSVMCDWDVQCHHIDPDMVCKSVKRDVTLQDSVSASAGSDSSVVSNDKRCVCGDIRHRDPDNGICSQVRKIGICIQNNDYFLTFFTST